MAFLLAVPTRLARFLKKIFFSLCVKDMSNILTKKNALAFCQQGKKLPLPFSYATIKGAKVGHHEATAIFLA